MFDSHVFCETLFQLTWSPALQDADVFFTVGCSPSKALRFNAKERHILEDVLRENDKKLVGIGPIGLDLHRDSRLTAPSKNQIEIFSELLHLAVRWKLPVSVLARESGKEVMRIMEQILPSDWPIHLRCPKTWEECKEWIRVFPNLKFALEPMSSRAETVFRLPLNKILLESNSPWSCPNVSVLLTMKRGCIIKLRADHWP